MGALRNVSAGASEPRGSPNGLGSAQARNSAGSGGVRGSAMGELHGDADRRLFVPGREWVGASELARRRRITDGHRQPTSTIAVRARDLPFVECEAAPAGGHVAVRVRSPTTDALALGE